MSLTVCRRIIPPRLNRRLVVYMLSLATCSGAATSANDNLTLAEKARLFGIDLTERFLQDGQVRVRRRLPSIERPYVTYNMSDTAYMTGLYCATATW